MAAKVKHHSTPAQVIAWTWWIAYSAFCLAIVLAPSSRFVSIFESISEPFGLLAILASFSRKSPFTSPGQIILMLASTNAMLTWVAIHSWSSPIDIAIIPVDLFFALFLAVLVRVSLQRRARATAESI